MVKRQSKASMVVMVYDAVLDNFKEADLLFSTLACMKWFLCCHRPHNVPHSF